MQDHEILKKIIKKSREKPVFMLSELLPAQTFIDPDREEIKILLKSIRSSGLQVKKKGSDYQVARDGGHGTFILSHKETSQLRTYLEKPDVPDLLQSLVGEYIRKKTGKDWNDPVTLERLRSAIMQQKGEYWREGTKKKIRYQKGYRVLAYLAYQFPVYFAQFENILAMLAESGLLKEEMTILDIGSGPGVASLAVTDFLSRTGRGTAGLFAIEQSDEQREAYTFLTSGFSQGVPHVTMHPVIDGDIRNVSPETLPHQVDLLVFQNVLNEITDLTPAARAALVHHLSEVLSPSGIVLIVEPADMSNSLGLRELAGYLSRAYEFTVISPCYPGWTRKCQPDRCWSFIKQNPVRPTRLMDAVSDHPESYRFRNTDIKYSYAVLAKDKNIQIKGLAACGKKFAPFSGLSRHVERRINVCAAVMSEDLGDQRTHLWKLCDGTPQKPVYAVMPSYNRSTDNASLMNIPYGQVIRLSGVLVRYNPHYDSYNLLVKRDTRVTVPG